MTDTKETKTTRPPCAPRPFAEIPTDLITRLTHEADRRCDPAQDRPALVPLAHQVILTRHED
ncbi:MAG: hypothetical protein AAFN63_18325 [Pseudomonadota bacterium]